jgi:ABC-type antimicrobial peptide transport system permease subunit
VLKAIGFRRRLLFGTLLAEATLLAAGAGAVGVAASWGIAEGLASVSSTNPAMGPLASFVITNTVVVQGLFLSLFLGIITGFVPSFGAARRSVALTLREVF